MAFNGRTAISAGAMRSCTIGAAAIGAALVLLVGGFWRRSKLRSKLQAESET